MLVPTGLQTSDQHCCPFGICFFAVYSWILATVLFITKLSQFFRVLYNVKASKEALLVRTGLPTANQHFTTESNLSTCTASAYLRHNATFWHQPEHDLFLINATANQICHKLA